MEGVATKSNTARYDGPGERGLRGPGGRGGNPALAAEPPFRAAEEPGERACAGERAGTGEHGHRERPRSRLLLSKTVQIQQL